MASNPLIPSKGSRIGQRPNLLSRGQFLRVAYKAAHWYKDGKLQSITFDKGMLNFKVRSHSRPHMFHTISIELASIVGQLRYNAIARRQASGKSLSSSSDRAFMKVAKPLTRDQVRRALEVTPLRINCTCEMWKWWGFQYIAWRKGFGLVPQHHIPHIRNPLQKGYVCNHVFYVLSIIYPTILPTIERYLVMKGLLKYPDPEKNEAKS